MISYYSTKDNHNKVSFKDAVLAGLAPDRGLYMPEIINKFDGAIYNEKFFSGLAYRLAKVLIGDEFSDNELKKLADEAFNFDVPLKHLDKNIYVLELFHGPSAAFKDFGARFMARVMSSIIQEKNQKLTILVATSGDTGSAVAKGFYNVPNIDVVILYPKGKVSFLQEKQLTTLGKNITALEVRGNFDDCQHMVKEAFIDKELNNKMLLSSANSINIARLFPQSFYYAWAYMQAVKDRKSEVIFCTPSGNFGNLTGGLIAKKMGLPVKKFIAATNVNDVVPEYLYSGVFTPRPSVHTYSNAMDVGNPSNFDRMLAIYKTKEEMIKDIVGYKVTDGETIETISEVYKNCNYILDPHGAVGYNAINKFIKESGENELPIILLETAHPAKFGETIKKAIGNDIPVPEVLQEALEKEKHSIEIDNNIESLKEYLFSRK